jgi:hypothetical protein
LLTIPVNGKLESNLHNKSGVWEVRARTLH